MLMLKHRKNYAYGNVFDIIRKTIRNFERRWKKRKYTQNLVVFSRSAKLF